MSAEHAWNRQDRETACGCGCIVPHYRREGVNIQPKTFSSSPENRVCSLTFKVRKQIRIHTYPGRSRSAISEETQDPLRAFGVFQVQSQGRALSCRTELRDVHCLHHPKTAPCHSIVETNPLVQTTLKDCCRSGLQRICV